MFNFGDQTRTGVFIVVWSLAIGVVLLKSLFTQIKPLVVNRQAIALKDVVNKIIRITGIALQRTFLNY